MFELNEAQARAATTLSGRVSIAAGAGSGKTRVLAERSARAVVNGLVPGWSPIGLDGLLAITFTEKAAGELAERVRDTLRSMGQHDLAADVDAAWISTIHGMCARILRSSAIEAGIDPSFAVLDTVTTGRLREQALETVVRELVSERGEGLALLGEYRFDQVAEAVVALAADLSRSGLPAAAMVRQPHSSSGELYDRAVAFFRKTACEFEGCDAPDEIRESHAAGCEKTLEHLERLREAGLEDRELAHEVWRIVSQHRQPATRKGVDAIKQQVKEGTAALAAEAVATLTGERCDELLELTSRFAERFAADKRDAGALDFDDLQRITLELFTQRPDVAARWADAFGITMVDEFQDTDAQQLRIVTALAGDALCTVGDAMQSIYRFRGADVDVYRDHNQGMEENGAACVELAVNYRSHSAILDFVNAVFDSLGADELVHLRAGRVEPEPPVVHAEDRVELYTTPRDAKADPARRTLAARIAARIEELHRVDGVALKDVVVLLRAYAPAEVYADALRSRGIDAVVVGGNRFLGRSEVGVLRALCRALGNRSDEEALGVVLASPLCAVSDGGLAALRRSVTLEESSSLHEALTSGVLTGDDAVRWSILDRALADAERVLGVRPLGEILLRVFEDTGWDLACLAQRTAGLQTYATVLMLARMADRFDSDDGRGPAAFAAYLDDKERFGDHEAPAAAVGEHADAVRIMSIHASKGLEFPVVVVPELDGTERSESGIVRWTLRPDPRIAMQLPSSWGTEGRKSPWFEDIHEQVRAEAEAELQRLWYVAFTRARELLILAGIEPSATSRSMMATLSGLLGTGWDGQGAALPGVYVEHVPVLHDAEEPEAIARPARVKADIAEWADLLRRDTPASQTSPPPARMSYTGLKSFDECARRFRAQRVLGMADRAGKEGAGGPAAGIGSAVHAALQAGLRASDTDRIGAIARFHRLDADATARLTRALDAWYGSDVAARVADFGGSLRREAPFAIRIGGADDAGFTLDGAIDLYAKADGTALIVDYKTGTSGSGDDLRGRYELQARCYALAAMRDGAESVSVVFVRPEVLGDDGAVQRVEYEYGGSDASAIEEGLLARFTLMSRGEYGPRSRRDERVCCGCPVAKDCPAPG